MARGRKTGSKAPVDAQEGREGLDMDMDTPGAQETSEAAQEGAAAQEMIGPDNPEDLLGCEEESMDEAELQEDVLTEYVVTAEGGLRLREAPSAEAPVLATLPWGAGVFADEESIGNWLPVTTGLLSGYMMAEHLIPLSPALKQMAAGHG